MLRAIRSELVTLLEVDHSLEVSMLHFRLVQVDVIDLGQLCLDQLDLLVQNEF